MGGLFHAVLRLREIASEEKRRRATDNPRVN
jgi:hypothetical protein